ncbi:MAG: C40 family peptidase [Parachlamydia sp.]|nr:C40 family peptidase [Parachlamydia sp.]
MSNKFRVNVPVADLRREPKPAFVTSGKDPLQESQLLLGDRVTAIKESGSWLYVEVPEQSKFDPESGWKGYPGWVQKAQLIEVPEWPVCNLVVRAPWADLYQGNKLLYSLSMGTKLEGIAQRGDTWRVRLPDGQEATIGSKSVQRLNHPDLEAVRQDILSLSAQFSDCPYVWGGRSAHRADWPHTLTGVDCSGLVSLLYRVHGFSLPRDAQDQFLASEPREINQLRSADLIFLAPLDQPDRISHVMMFKGGDTYIDANTTDGRVATNTAVKKFGIPFQKMAWGQIVDKYRIFFGAVG